MFHGAHQLHAHHPSIQVPQPPMELALVPHVLATEKVVIARWVSAPWLLSKLHTWRHHWHRLWCRRQCHICSRLGRWLCSNGRGFSLFRRHESYTVFNWSEVNYVYDVTITGRLYFASILNSEQVIHQIRTFIFLWCFS